MQKQHVIAFDAKQDARYAIVQRGSHLIKSTSQWAAHRHAEWPAQFNGAYISADPGAIRLAQAFQPITNRLGTRFGCEEHGRDFLELRHLDEGCTIFGTFCQGSSDEIAEGIQAGTK